LEVSLKLSDENPESLFKSWLTEHGGAILKVARAYTVTTEDCQDLVQEILLQVWRSLPQFQGRASPLTWLYRVALNTALGWHRKERRRRVRQRPILELDLSVEGPDGAQQAARREVVERLYQAIRRLPKTEAALVLLYLDDLNYRQMAEVLGISESNVGVKLNRARKALSKLMNGEPNDP
jgi:RNA polymerase sigma-70 factor (ECF subfamily)